MPQDGIEGVCRVVIGCAQPDWWKIPSVDPNVEWFLSRGGSLGSHIRSLLPQQKTPDKSGVVWFSLRSLWPEQLVTETCSLHIRMVTVTQSMCPSTEIEFGKALRCLDVGSVVFSGKWKCNWHKLFVFLCKRAIMVPLCVVWRMGTSLSHCPQNQLFDWAHWRALGYMGFHLNKWIKDQDLVRVMGGDRSLFTALFCGLWVWLVACIKDPCSTLQLSLYWRLCSTLL